MKKLAIILLLVLGVLGNSLADDRSISASGFVKCRA